MQGSPEGHHWGAAGALLRTSSQGPYWWNPHEDDVAHGFWCGPTGKGKTVAMGFAITMLLPAGVKVVWFDYKRGAEVLIRALEGRYHLMRNGEPTGWNPFAMAPTAHNVAFLQMLVRRLANKTGRPMSIKQELEAEEAVTRMMSGPAHQRSVTSLLTYLDGSEDDSVAMRLSRWARGGSMGWLFDNEDDTLRFDTQGTGFDLTDFLENNDTRDVATLYLMHQMRSHVIGKQRAALVWDEAPQALVDDEMAAIVKNAHQTFRSRDAFIWTATQDPASVLDTPAGHLMRSQTAKRYFLPDRGATAETYGERGFGLTDTEIEIVRGLSIAEREILVKHASGPSVVVRLRLPPCAPLAILAGTDKRADLCAEMRAHYGEQYRQWAGPFETARVARGL